MAALSRSRPDCVEQTRTVRMAPCGTPTPGELSHLAILLVVAAAVFLRGPEPFIILGARCGFTRRTTC